ncbi:MAG: penicillin-binding protein 2 [Myxococcaceae bacterium]
MGLGQNSPGRDLKTRYLYLGGAMLAGLVVLAVNLYRLQIVRGDEYLAKSQENFIKPIRVRADRGMIKDRRGQILADGRPSFDVFVTPAFCQRCSAEVLPRLAAYLKWDEAQQARAEAAVKAARGPARFTPIAVRVDLSRDELDVLNAHPDELPGVDLEAVPHRNYRSGTVLAHVLGYMNEVTQEELDNLNAKGGDYALGDYLGRRGIERYFEGQLRGEDGQRKEVVNARGQSMRDSAGLIAEGDVVPPRPGKNVILSIDARLQAEAERAFPGVAGAVVALDVRTGFILAMVSRPSYDPNTFTGRVSNAQMAAMAKDPLQPMMFRPVAMHYSPGSTFKPFTMLAGLKSGLFNPHSSVNCTGGYRLGARTWRCHTTHGLRDARQSLQASCDTFFYKVADTIGLDPIAEMGKALGLGAPTGIGVVGEVPGIMPDVAYHDRVTPGGYQKGMALNSAIGQGDDNVTPLQLTLAYAAIANGGTLYQPQLVRRVEAADGRVLEEFQPKVVRQVPIPPEHQKFVVDALVAVVNEAGGTATRVRLKDVVMAGKTGTAQVQRLGLVREKKDQMDYFTRDHAWFAAFAPAEDPEIAVVVLNEHGGHGGSEAAPTAAAVMQKYFDLKRGDAEASLQSAPPPPPPAPEPPKRPVLTPAAPGAASERSLAAVPPSPLPIPEAR